MSSIIVVYIILYEMIEKEIVKSVKDNIGIASVENDNKETKIGQGVYM